MQNLFEGVVIINSVQGFNGTLHYVSKAEHRVHLRNLNDLAQHRIIHTQQIKLRIAVGDGSRDTLGKIPPRVDIEFTSNDRVH